MINSVSNFSFVGLNEEGSKMSGHKY